MLQETEGQHSVMVFHGACAIHDLYCRSCKHEVVTGARAFY